MRRGTWIKAIELGGRELGLVLGNIDRGRSGGVFELRRFCADGGDFVYAHGMDVWFSGCGFVVSRYTSGVHLYVREHFYEGEGFVYAYGLKKSEYLKKGFRSRSPVFMGLEKSRFILQVLDVRVERCSRISDEGIRLNGWTRAGFREHVLKNRPKYERGDWEFVYRVRVYWAKDLSSQKKL